MFLMVLCGMGKIERYVAALAQPAYHLKLNLNPLMVLSAHLQGGEQILAVHYRKEKRCATICTPQYLSTVRDILRASAKARMLIGRACELEALLALPDQDWSALPELADLPQSVRTEKQGVAETYTTILTKGHEIIERSWYNVQSAEVLLTSASDFDSEVIRATHDMRYPARTVGRILDFQSVRAQARVHNLISFGNFNRKLRSHCDAHLETYLAWHLICAATDATTESLNTEIAIPEPLAAPLTDLRDACKRIDIISRNARDRMRRLVADDGRFLSELGVPPSEPTLDTLLTSLG